MRSDDGICGLYMDLWAIYESLFGPLCLLEAIRPRVHALEDAQKRRAVERERLKAG